MYLSNCFLYKLALVSLFSLSTATELSLPKPAGSYGTTIKISKLVDGCRIDPFSPTQQPRSLMVSIFRPIKSSQCSRLLSTDYMPPATAALYDETYGAYGIPNGTFESFKLQVCSESSKYRDNTKYPLLIFSPGLGNSRHLYNVLVQSVASTGYIVVSIDHPYDVSIVEYPDGTTVLAEDIETDAQIELALATRAQDVSFVLNQLDKSSISKLLLPGLDLGLNLDKVGIFGHSLGGATSLAAMVNDSRITGGINIDGSFFGPSIQQGTKRPFLLISHEGKNQSTDVSWASTWAKLSGWKSELEIKGTQHGSFTDLPSLIYSLGLTGKLPETVTNLLGTLEGLRVAEIKRVYVAAFFDLVLKGRRCRLLTRKSTDYPEVVVVDT